MTEYRTADTALSSLLPGLWFCRSCFAVQLISAVTRTGLSREEDEEFIDEDEDEQATFVHTHWRHGLAPLKKKTDRYTADRPLWDPLRTAYEEVSDGRENFLLKSWRTHLSEPRHYALLRGTLPIVTTVRLADAALQKELVREFPCSSAQADAIVQKLQRVVAALPPEELAPAYCSADDPQVTFSYLSEHQLQRFVESCQEARVLDRVKLREFFLRQQREDSLVLELRRQCEMRFQ